MVPGFPWFRVDVCGIGAAPICRYILDTKDFLELSGSRWISQCGTLSPPNYSVSARNGGTSPASSRICGAFLFLWRSAWRCRFLAGGVASARVSPEPFRSRCARSRIRAPCAARVRAGACVCTGSARGEIRGRRSSSNGGLHAGSSVERINGNAWRTAARLRLRSVVRRIRRCAVPRSNRGALDTSCLRGSIARRGLARGPGQSPHGPVRKRRARCAE